MDKILLTVLQAAPPVAALPDVTEVVFVPKDGLHLAGIGDAGKYGILEVGKNPTGDADADGKLPEYEVKGKTVKIGGDTDDFHREALKEPLFKGGDRFFPDATADDTALGKNIVRVRATVSKMAVGDKVVFRSFDVDDPSTDGFIDGSKAATSASRKPKHDPNGGDNRGQLANNLHTPTASRKPYAAGDSFEGRLRFVNAGNALGGWGGNGATVEATVKELVDAMGNVEQDAAGNAILVAEVDLLTTFAPGDNFRVLALPKRMESVFEKVGTDEDDENVKHIVPTAGKKPRLSPQLSVWRYLNVEDDSSVNVYGLMGSGVNRQSNRFADAYLEPKVVDGAIDTSNPPAGGKLTLNAKGAPTGAIEAAIDAHRQTKDLESPLYWAVYVTDSYTQPKADVFGYTYNKDAIAKYDVSLVFNANIAADFNGGAATAGQKTAVHEVAHQLLAVGGPFDDKHGHRGKPILKDDPGDRGSVSQYYQASDGLKRAERWGAVINIMSRDVIQVPMDNGAATLSGGTAGPIDRFYFFSLDIAAMRDQLRVDESR